MYTLNMKLSGTMRGIPAPTQPITRRFITSTTMFEYLAGLLDNPEFNLTIEHMEITQDKGQ